MNPTPHRHANIDYTNWRGERYWRKILPIAIWHGTTEWHHEPQWFLRAMDIEKGELRDFAMTNINGWGTP